MKKDPLWLAFLFGIASAVLYAATNICMRQVTHVDAVWVSFIKALPTFLLVIPAVLLGRMRGHTMFPQTGMVLQLLLTSLIVQLFGNVGFQWSLSILGLAVSVPIVLGTMLVGGGLIGRLLLGERVGSQKVVAMVVLIAATTCLSLGAMDAHSSNANPQSIWVILLGLAAAIASGFAYALLGAMIRKSMQGGTPLSSTLCVLSGIGSAFLLVWTIRQIGFDGMLQTESSDLAAMWVAGLFNALAFFAMARSLKQLSVLFVQMLNASQAGLAVLAGWFLFSETLNSSLWLGLLLTGLGLTVAGLRRPTKLFASYPFASLTNSTSDGEAQSAAQTLSHTADSNREANKDQTGNFR